MKIRPAGAKCYHYHIKHVAVLRTKLFVYYTYSSTVGMPTVLLYV